MSITLLGQLVTSEGMVLHFDAADEPADVTILPAVRYLRQQPLDLPVFFDHDNTWRLGSVVALERSRRWGLMVGASLDADVADLLADHGPWFLSDRVSSRPVPDSTVMRSEGRLHEVSLVRATASCQTSPVVWSTDDSEPYPMRYSSDTWQRVVEAIGHRRYHRAQPLRIHDLDELDFRDEYGTDPDTAEARMRSWITTRPATRVPGSEVMGPVRTRTFAATWRMTSA